ncbi:hypothetical protein D3C86_1368510 [compost metagenome]
MRIDQQAVAVDFHRTLAVGGHVDRIYRRLRVVNHQAVGAAIHDTQCRIRTRTECTWLAGQPFGGRGEVAQTQKVALQFALGIEVMHGVIDLTVDTTGPGQLQVD